MNRSQSYKVVGNQIVNQAEIKRKVPALKSCNKIDRGNVAVFNENSELGESAGGVIMIVYEAEMFPDEGGPIIRMSYREIRVVCAAA